nr:flagellar basal body protein [Microbacterium suwonense]
MSTFSGLGTAASALAAARRGMDVVGQNIANQGTEGYTRQRVSTSAIPAATLSTRFSTGPLPGHGVSVDGIVRLGDALLDARVRESSSAAGFWSARALAATTAEAAMGSPASTAWPLGCRSSGSAGRISRSHPTPARRRRWCWRAPPSSPRRSPVATARWPRSGPTPGPLPTVPSYR